MTRSRPVAAVALPLALVTTVAPAGPVAARTRPEGEMRFAFYVTISPDYVWPSGVGPRVAEPALLLIDPYPGAAPTRSCA